MYTASKAHIQWHSNDTTKYLLTCIPGGYANVSAVGESDISDLYLYHF